MKRNKRRKYLVDGKVQGTLILRLMSYWFFTWLWMIGLSIGVVLIYGLVIEPVPAGTLIARIMRGVWLPLLLSLIALPLVIWDCIRVSNRFAGPMLRFRRAIRELCDGKTPEPIRLRKRDHWHEVADDFNRMFERLRNHDDVANTDQAEHEDELRDQSEELITY